MLGAVRRKQVFLTLSAAAKTEDLLEAYQRFELAPLAGLIITKLDETVSHGPIITLLHKTQKGALFFADQQDLLAPLKPGATLPLARLALFGEERTAESTPQAREAVSA